MSEALQYCFIWQFKCKSIFGVKSLERGWIQRRLALHHQQLSGVRDKPVLNSWLLSWPKRIFKNSFPILQVLASILHVYLWLPNELGYLIILLGYKLCNAFREQCTAGLSHSAACVVRQWATVWRIPAAPTIWFHRELWSCPPDRKA